VLFDEPNGLEQLIDATLAVRNEHSITGSGVSAVAVELFHDGYNVAAVAATAARATRRPRNRLITTSNTSARSR
jgi:hypothetical protein